MNKYKTFLILKKKKSVKFNLKFGGQYWQSEMNKAMDQDLVTESLSLWLSRGA